MDDRHATLHGMLRELHLTTMAGVCSDVALKAAREGLSHEAYLLELARLEVEARVQRRRDRRLAESGLPREKTFATLRLDRFPAPIRLHIERIRRGEWIEQATNIIAIGPPGAGKTHSTYYPYRPDHATARRDRPGGRSTPSSLWAHASLSGDYEFPLPGSVLHCLDSPHSGTSCADCRHSLAIQSCHRLPSSHFG